MDWWLQLRVSVILTIIWHWCPATVALSKEQNFKERARKQWI